MTRSVLLFADILGDTVEMIGIMFHYMLQCLLTDSSHLHPVMLKVVLVWKGGRKKLEKSKFFQFLFEII